MKVAVTCDHILERKYWTRIFEAILEIFEEAEVYTIAHRPKGVLGRIELRRIHSTFLSNFVKTENALFKNSMLIPGAARNLVIPCSYDLVINITTGLSHGITTCERTKVVTYLVEDLISKRDKKSLREKLFSGYLNSWSNKSFLDSDEIWVGSEKLRSSEKFKDKAKLLLPFFNINDFPIFPEAQAALFPRDFVVIQAESLSLESAQSFISLLDKIEMKYRFVGVDHHLKTLKESVDSKFFLGKKCSGELAPLFSAALCAIDFSTDSWNEFTYQAMATGRPVIVNEKSLDEGHISVGNGVYSFRKENEIPDIIQKVIQEHQNLEPKKIRGQVSQFHEIKFKSEVKRRLERLFDSK